MSYFVGGGQLGVPGCSSCSGLVAVGFGVDHAHGSWATAGTLCPHRGQPGHLGRYWQMLAGASSSAVAAALLVGTATSVAKNAIASVIARVCLCMPPTMAAGWCVVKGDLGKSALSAVRKARWSIRNGLVWLGGVPRDGACEASARCQRSAEWVVRAVGHGQIRGSAGGGVGGVERHAGRFPGCRLGRGSGGHGGGSGGTDRPLAVVVERRAGAVADRLPVPARQRGDDGGVRAADPHSRCGDARAASPTGIDDCGVRGRPGRVDLSGLSG